LQLLTSGNSYSSDENLLIDSNSNKEKEKTSLCKNRSLVFKVIDPPNYVYFLEPKFDNKNTCMQSDKRVCHKNSSTTNLGDNQKSRKSDLNSCLNSKIVLNEFLDPPPEMKKSRTISQYLTPVIEKLNVFKIDDRLCFKSILTPNKSFHSIRKVF